MSKNWFLVKALAALIIIGLLIMGGLAIHRIGWAEGYRMAQLAAGDEGGATVPYAPYGFGHPRMFLTVGLLLLLLIVIGKAFRFWVWKMAWGPWMMGGPWMMAGGPKARHWRRHHGPVPPWCWWDEEPSEETRERAEPDAETGGAGTEA